MVSTTNQTVLSLYTAMRAKANNGSCAITSIAIEDVQKLADFVNGQTDTASALSALAIAMQNASGLTSVDDVIKAATAFYTFIYTPDTTPA